MEDSLKIFIPGRLCLIGEHSDWAAKCRLSNKLIEKGYAITIGLNLGIFLSAHKFSKFEYHFLNRYISLELDELLTYAKNDFFEYVVSCAKIIYQKYKIFGAYIKCEKMTLPMKKGLSSSAAICVGIIRVFNILYNLKLNSDQEMKLAYEAEHSTGSCCGEMDQIVAYGFGMRQICFDYDKVTVTKINSKTNLKFLLVDLNGTKNTKKILSDLNSAFISESINASKLIYFLGEFNKKCILSIKKYLINGDLEKIGNIMNDYQSKFDENVSCFSNELESPNLHILINFCKSNNNVLACKGVGSHGDGIAQILLKDNANPNELINILYENFKYKSYYFETM